MDNAVEVRDAGRKGLGVFALRDFCRRDLILRFARGRVVHADELAALSPREQRHLGELTVDTCQILPAPRCYINHACIANAMSSSDAVHAWRDIHAGEEITIDYRLNALDDWEMSCACAANSHPHVVIGSFFTLSDDLQRQYVTYAPPFIQEEYRRRHGDPSRDLRYPFGEPLWPTRWLLPDE